MLPELDPPPVASLSLVSQPVSEPPLPAASAPPQTPEPKAEAQQGLTVVLPVELDEPEIRRVPFSVRLDESVVDRLERFVSAKRKRGGVGRTRQSVTEKALDAYLKAHGF